MSELDSQLWLEQGHTEGKVLAFTAVCSGLALLFNDDDLYKRFRGRCGEVIRALRR